MCICNGRVQIQSHPAGRTDTCVRLNIKEVLAVPTRNVEAQTDEIACQDLGCPKGQLHVTEGVAGHGLPARALQAPASEQGASKPEAAEVLTWCGAGDILLLRCRNTEGPLSWNPSDLLVTRLRHSFGGVGRGLHRPQEVVFQPW